MTDEENDIELEALIRKSALLNAVKHDGRAQEGAVISKILGERPEFRTKVKELSTLVSRVVHEVNRIPVEEQKDTVAQKWPELLVREKTEEDKHLPPLRNFKEYRQIVTRFSPNPDCVLHLGSARAIILSSEYAHMYHGKFILRYEDTDPKLKKPVREFYQCIKEDLNWLHCLPDEVYIQSGRIEIYYEYAEKLIKGGHAYICGCPSELFRTKILKKQACDCRDCDPESHLEKWQEMVKGVFKEGEAVLRVKTELNHPNPAVRDWPAARIIDSEKYPHPLVGSKYHVWPLYNLSAAVDDHLMGVTHIIRGKEHLTNQTRQEYLYKYLGWKYPETIHYGRLKITGASLSKSVIVQGIREGLYEGWDDPRLATFAALRRRGVTAEAVKRMIVDVGPKTSDVTLSWENLYAYNRKILDPAANRYFFVPNPVQMTVRNVPRKFIVELRLHPEHPERGFRVFEVIPDANGSSALWVSRKDMERFKDDQTVRLMELFNIRIDNIDLFSVEATFLSESYEDAHATKAQLIHWVPAGQDMPAKVMMPDAAVVEGVAEESCRQLKTDSMVQFERFGFVRIEKDKDKLTAYYAHK